MPIPHSDSSLLHITNGDVTANNLCRSTLSGAVISWKDVLHEGPVPAGLSATARNDLRARWMAARGWAAYDSIFADFERRDRRLDQVPSRSQIVLWFEHDLYDQLQLIQVLDHLQRSGPRHEVSLICIDAFPGVDNFSGLGQLSPDQLKSLFPRRVPVTQDHVALTSAAWVAFTSPEPSGIERLIESESDLLPFLAQALRRHCQEFPSVESGLSRTEHQILSALSTGAETPSHLFTASQAHEEAPFMGDLPLWSILVDLASGSTPALRFGSPATPLDSPAFAHQRITMTEHAAAILAGSERYQLPAAVDRWRGGVHLPADGQQWQWNGQRLVAGDATGDA